MLFNITDLFTKYSGDKTLIYGNFEFNAVLHASAVLPDSGSPSSSIDNNDVFSEFLSFYKIK